MRTTLHQISLALLAACFISCAPPGGDATRTLGHAYQDSRGLTIVTLFEIDGEARGGATTMGGESSRTSVTLPLAEFERLWNQLDEAEISRFAIQDSGKKFEAQNNYVIVKGTMPGGSKTTYVIPKGKASAKTKSWVKAFRTSTQS